MAVFKRLTKEQITRDYDPNWLLDLACFVHQFTEYDEWAISMGKPIK
ncbi:hypothetical protein [Proteus mirabilis]|nr:hypothetical protein [Proteus mirabilis]EKW2644248.1 hypothetical protein [Proteus mirabilis]MBF0802488.1 hypothetical protein [Proteus mirabilis]UHD50923.1 hypothetical protein LUA10_06265 [Proteus mirabilis]USA33567.1 hypothetical protein NBG97_06680 [Proteus mirabilis]USA37411.1 hypothetical protein NBG99_06680 [Proteus mirabilis]